MKNRLSIVSFAIACLLFVVLAQSIVCHAQEVASEPAPNSKLTGIALPAKAERITDKAALQQFLGHLNELFEGGKKKPQNPEVIAWDKDKGFDLANTKSNIAQVQMSLQKLGYKTEMRDVGEQNGINIKVMIANKAELGDGEIVMGIWFVMPDGLILAWGKTMVIPDPPGPATGGKVLADGAPPLTTNFVDAFLSAMNRVFDVPNNADTKKKVQRNLLSIWQSDDQDSMSNAVRFLMYDEQMSQKGEDAPLVRGLMRAEMLKQAGEPAANLILRQLKDFYTDAHPPVATSNNGAPPLTREAQQAFASFALFGMKEMPGGVQADETDYREWLADWAVDVYKNGDAGLQETLSQMPLVWMALQKSWRTISEAERSSYRQKFAVQFKDAAAQIKLHQASQAALKAVEVEAGRFNRLRAQGAVKPEDAQSLANLEDKAVKALRAEGGRENIALARRYEDYAGKMRNQETALRNPAPPPDSGNNKMPSAEERGGNTYGPEYWRTMRNFSQSLFIIRATGGRYR